jgi:hypothetical protein
MAKRLGVYSSKAVSLVICAIPINDGRADEFVTVDADAESFATEVSADGAVMRYDTGNTLYSVKVKLKGYSLENAKLAALHALDTNSPNGAGIGAFLLKDSNGSTLMASDKCWIQKPPSKGFGKTLPDCEWEIKVVANPAQMLIGGN